MSAGVPMLIAVALSAIRLMRPASTLPVPTSINRVTPRALMIGHAFAPSYCSGHLRDEAGSDRFRVNDRRGVDIGDKGRFGREYFDAFQRRLHHERRRLHQCAMKWRGHRQNQSPLRAGKLGELRRALHRRRRARNDDLTAAVVDRRMANCAGEIKVARRLSGDLHDRPKIEADDGGHRALSHRHGLLHGLPAQTQKTRCVLQRQRPGGAESRIVAERMAGDVGRAPGDIEAGLGLQNPQSGDARGHQRRLGVGGQREFALGALEHQPRQVLGERRVDPREHLARHGIFVSERLAHADRL